MIRGHSVLAIIPARGGSKGLPRKNLLDLAGKPLIAWTIEVARACPHIDRLILSSEDREIREVARAWGCETPFERPMALAGDDTPGMAVIRHALDAIPERYDLAVVLQPTSPLRLPEDISACLKGCTDGDAPSCVSVSPVDKSPWWTYFMDGKSRLQPVLGADNTRVGRQALPPAYALNGAVYAARSGWLRQTGGFIAAQTMAHVMPRDRSVDIDDRLDFTLAGLLLDARRSDRSTTRA